MNTHENLLELLESKLGTLGNIQDLEQFVEAVNNIMEVATGLDILITNTQITGTIFGKIYGKVEKIFLESNTLFDELDVKLNESIKKNLEAIFYLTETIQTILNYIYNHSPVHLYQIEPVLVYMPKYMEMFALQWKNSSGNFKTSFEEEIYRILEVMKHLYDSFLHLLEFSVNVEFDDKDLLFLCEVLTSISNVPSNFKRLDASCLISSWKCFGTLITKYSTQLPNFNVKLSVSLLTDNIWDIMDTLDDNDLDAFRRQLKILRFLMKIMMNAITQVFFDRLSGFFYELVVFYVKVFEFSPVLGEKLSSQAFEILESEVFSQMQEFLQHLLEGQSVLVKEYLPDISRKIDKNVGYLLFLSKLCKIFALSDLDWSPVLAIILDNTFDTLPHCSKSIFIEKTDLFQKLIVNSSAVILMQDINFISTELLVRNMLGDNLCKSFLALEIFSLVSSNIPPNERQSLLISLLYGLDELLYGFFTHRPQILYVKFLVQRLFKSLPDTLKADVIKLFKPDQSIHTWRLLSFDSVPSNQKREILQPVMENVGHFIKKFPEETIEDCVLNITEGIELISTLDSESIMAQNEFSEILGFLDNFWSSSINLETWDNNILRYFLIKIGPITSKCLENEKLQCESVFQKLKFLCTKPDYWVMVFKIICSLLSVRPRREIVCFISEIIPLTLSKNQFIKEIYLDMLKNLNIHHNVTLNLLLDTLNPQVSSQIFEYIENSKSSKPIPLVNQDFEITPTFRHLCLKWKPNYHKPTPKISIEPPVKKFKVQEKNEMKPAKNPMKRYIVPKENTQEIFEDDSSASEVITRLKSEVKCLLKLCGSEKLTVKNSTDLRIIMSQISSVMK